MPTDDNNTQKAVRGTVANEAGYETALSDKQNVDELLESKAGEKRERFDMLEELPVDASEVETSEVASFETAEFSEMGVLGSSVEARRVLASKTELAHDPVTYYTRNLHRYALLSKEEEYAMACAVRAGDVALEKKFILANLRLVLKVASSYRKRGLAFADLIEEGNLGLMHAVKRFDPEKGFRFATYAVWWVRQAIERALMSQTRTIRLPVHVVKRLSRCVRLGEKAARNASVKNASDAVMAEEAKMTVADVRFLMAYRHNTVSLEQRSYADSERELSDFIADVDCPERNVSAVDFKEHLRRCMEDLSTQEAAIIAMRFGLDPYEEMSLNAIASAFSLTREQVRRLLHRGLEKMRQRIVNRSDHQAPW